MGTSDHIKYSDLVDIPKLQALMESFHQVTGVPNAVVDIKMQLLKRRRRGGVLHDLPRCYWRTSRVLSGGGNSPELRNGLMSRPPRRV